MHAMQGCIAVTTLLSCMLLKLHERESIGSSRGFSAHAKQVFNVSFRIDADAICQPAAVIVVVAGAFAAQPSKETSRRLGAMIALATNQPDFLILWSLLFGISFGYWPRWTRVDARIICTRNSSRAGSSTPALIASGCACRSWYRQYLLWGFLCRFRCCCGFDKASTLVGCVFDSLGAVFGNQNWDLDLTRRQGSCL